MKIKWLAHAAFLIEDDDLRIITDPYEPNDTINLHPITKPADIVIRSSDDDETLRWRMAIYHQTRYLVRFVEKSVEFFQKAPSLHRLGAFWSNQ